MKGNKKLKKSQILTFGSFLIFVGVCLIFSGYFRVLKEEVYELVRLQFLNTNIGVEEEVKDASEVSNIQANEDIIVNNNSNNNNEINTNNSNKNNKVKYDYIGYLEIPKISLKRGFLNKESPYNDIQYNIMVSTDAKYPDVENGNFILIAHSGDSYISFFAYLYKLKLDDIAYVTYNGIKYKYKLVKIEEQEKTGFVAIHRPNYQIRGLTLITCTKDNDYTQTIYIFELI